MKNSAFIAAVGVIVLGLYFILHSFLPVAYVQIEAAIASSEELFMWSTIAIGAITALFFYTFTSEHRLLGMAVGITIFTVGLLLFLKPTLGSRLADALLVALLLASGLFKLSKISQIQPSRLKWLTIGSGVISIIVAAVTAFYFFSAATYDLIAFLAIDFCVGGFVLLNLSFHNPKAVAKGDDQ